MKTATITISDRPDGAQGVTVDFGDGFDKDSTAHRITALLLKAVQELHEGDEPAEFQPVETAEVPT